jgi:Cys-rich protein (TIGR01571 family)
MSRPLHLDTQVAQNQSQRYSFIETPLEMHAGSQRPEPGSPPPPLPVDSRIVMQPQDAIEQQPPILLPPAPTHQQQQQNHQQERIQSHQYIPSEKERHPQEEGIIPTYSRYPPQEQHPAFQAPFSPPPEQQQHHQITQYAYVSPPSSPGPLPVKTHELPKRSDTLSIEPDANPLQSPKTSYFPPPPTPTVHGSHAPPVEDLSAFHQPGQIMHPNQEVQGGTWSHGLCDCSSIGTCCLGIICPCILYGRTQHRLSMKSRKEDPTNMLGYDTCNGSCTAMTLFCGCQCKLSMPSTSQITSLITTPGLLATIQHTRTRKAYGIEGDVCSDCVRATCCTCCTLIQDEKEFQKREERRGRAARERGATLLSPYTAPGPMTYGLPPK